jgi:hypothetical protein
LESLRKARLDGVIRGVEAEREYVKKLLSGGSLEGKKSRASRAAAPTRPRRLRARHIFEAILKKGRPKAWRERQALAFSKKSGARSFPRGQAAGGFPEAKKDLKLL